MKVTKDLHGKILKLVNVEMLTKLANGGEPIPADMLVNLMEVRVKRVYAGWVVCLPVNLEDKAVYDVEADAWDLEVPFVDTEVELCYEEKLI